MPLQAASSGYCLSSMTKPYPFPITQCFFPEIQIPTAPVAKPDQSSDADGTIHTGSAKSMVPGNEADAERINDTTNDARIFREDGVKEPHVWADLLPAVKSCKGKVTSLQPGPLNETDNEFRRRIQDFFASDLDVSKLNRIHKHLWFAGQPRQTRPLHQHLIAGRHDILITEDTNLHLLWVGSRLFIKPFPVFLLSHNVWKTFICQDTALYGSCLGFLLSYIALIRRPSDFHIARSRSLLPEFITWNRWKEYSFTVLQGGFSLEEYDRDRPFNPRYAYGELRLRQVNWIFRLCSLHWSQSLRTQFGSPDLEDHTPPDYGPKTGGDNPDHNKFLKYSRTFRGLLNDYHEYRDFFSNNIAWLTLATIYIALVLAAMQVGLGTSLGNNESFQALCYGFTIFAMIAPFAFLTIFVALIMGSLLVMNWTHTLSIRKKRKVQEDEMWKDEALTIFKH